MICHFHDVCEKDMDMLFLEEIVSDSAFATLFLAKIGVEKATVLQADHSLMDSELGETDFRVIFSTGENRLALLVEDKIDALAMPRQCERYFSRGQRGIDEGEYEQFAVCIVAPEKYLAQNEEAAKYPHKVTYEECAAFFAQKADKRSLFKKQQIEQAIQKQKNSYQVRVHEGVSSFWDAYIAYQKQSYPQLLLTTKGGSKGMRSTWPHYGTVIKGVYIIYKSELGVVDLTFPSIAERIVEFERVLNIQLGSLAERGVYPVKTGRAAALRIGVPKVDFKATFSSCVLEIEKSFKAVSVLTELAKDISQCREIMSMLV